MSLAQFLRILVARRLLIAILLFACIVGGVAASLLLPARYEGRARLMLDIIKPDPVTGTIIATQFLRAYTKTQVELISDFRTTGQVVERLGWAQDPARIESYQKSAVSQSEDLQHWLASGISGRIDAKMLDTSNILEITYTGKSPAEAKQIAGLLRDTFISESLELRQEGARRTAQWYQRQAAEALERLTVAENTRSKFARDNGVVLTADNADLETLRLNSLTQQTAAAASAAAPVVIGGQANPMQAQLDQLDQQISNASRTLGPNNPQLQALQAQREAVARAAARVPAAQTVSSGPNFARVEQEYEAQKARVISKRATMDRLAQMQNDIELQRGQYQKTAQRAADLQLEGDVAEAGMTPLGDASADEKPSFPNRPMIMIGALGAGLAFGIIAALALELVRRRIRGNRDLEQASDGPVFAVIGNRRREPGVSDRLLTFFNRHRALADSRPEGA